MNKKIQIYPMLTKDEMKVLFFLLPLSKNYPNIDLWFFNKVIPGYRNGSRRIIIKKNKDSEIIGLGIGKNENGEKKICTVRVHPNYRNKGIGKKLIVELMDWLKEDRPYFTINEQNLESFQKLFKDFNFKMTKEMSGLYNKKNKELIFNTKSVFYNKRQF